MNDGDVSKRVFQPVHEFTVKRRNLPHWQNPGAVYFITWRCRPEKKLSHQEQSLVLETINYWHRRRWTVFIALVMPDHVHVLAQPLPTPQGGYFDLGLLVKSVKGFSAKKINLQRGSQGPVWQPERYDRIIRDEQEFLEKWQYIRNNPVKAGLAPTPEEYSWLFEGDSPW